MTYAKMNQEILPLCSVRLFFNFAFRSTWMGWQLRTMTLTKHQHNSINLLQTIASAITNYSHDEGAFLALLIFYRRNSICRA